VTANSKNHPTQQSAAALFAAGVEDVRRGLPPRFDMMQQDAYWIYERGRQWAILAPKDLDPQSNLAARLLDAVFSRRWLI
jgi:hypothetical protein